MSHIEQVAREQLFASFQYEIYGRGLGGERPKLPISVVEQVDGVIAALDALPAAREAVGSDFTVPFDSGIRTGADVLKGLALGADAVCLGRPFVWGLGLDGQAGVEHVLRCLLAELHLTLALSGYTALAQVDGSALRRSD